MKYCFLLFIIVHINLRAQTCNINDTTDWEKVELRLMETKKVPKKLKLTGEGIIKVSEAINTIEELSGEEVRKIKVKAAKLKCCLVFVDMKDFHGSEMFPMRKAGKLYFYFGNLKR